MTDILFTTRGDLAIQNVLNIKDRLEVNFMTSKSSALRVNFFIEDTASKSRNANSLSVNFFVKQPIENQDVRLITGSHAMEQAIKIRLLTSLGSLSGNSTIGSKIETVMHSNIDNDSTKNSLIKYIKEAVSDLFTAPTVTIDKINTNYSDYSNGFTVVITDNNNQYRVQL